MKYLDCSYGQVLIYYIHQFEWHARLDAYTLVHVYWKYIIKSMRLTHGLVLLPIYCIWCYRHVLAHIVQLYSYTNGLRQVSHHQVICTNVHLLVDPTITYDGTVSRQNLPKNKIALALYYACQQRMCKVSRGLLESVFLINITSLQWSTSQRHLEFKIYKWDNKLLKVLCHWFQHHGTRLFWWHFVAILALFILPLYIDIL